MFRWKTGTIMDAVSRRDEMVSTAFLKLELKTEILYFNTVIVIM